MLDRIVKNRRNRMLEVVGGECTQCGQPMAIRRNRKTGEYFKGCLTYPKCRGARPLDQTTVQMMIELSFGVLPLLVCIADSPEFLRGEWDAINAIRDALVEYDQEFRGEVFRESAKDWLAFHHSEQVIREYLGDGAGIGRKGS